MTEREEEKGELPSVSRKWASPSELIEGGVGFIASSREDHARSIGHVLRGTMGGRFFSSFQEAWSGYKERGRISEDYGSTEQMGLCLSELLEFLENDIPDSARALAMQKILLVASTEEHSTRESALPHEYMKIIRGMTSGEAMVLFATFEISSEDHPSQGSGGARGWLDRIAAQSGLRFPELVEAHEAGLMGKKLLTPRTHADGSGVNLGPRWRLTDLGFSLCSFISEFEDPCDS